MNPAESDFDHKDFFQSLADGAPVMIWMAGVDMGCFYFNRAWLDFRGRTLAEEQGNGWAEGVHPEDLDRCVNHYVTCFERRIAFAMSYRLRDHTGEYRWILDRGAPHSLPDGTFLGYFGGCAEIAQVDAIDRHVQLRSSLIDMRNFALRVASESDGIVGAKQASNKISQELPSVDPASETLQRKNFARTELRQLADDMLTHANIGLGQFIPGQLQDR